MSKRIHLPAYALKILFQNLAHAKKFYAISTAIKTENQINAKVIIAPKSASHNVTATNLKRLFTKIYFELSIALTIQAMTKNTVAEKSIVDQSNVPTKSVQATKGFRRICIIVTPPQSVVN